MSRKRGEFGTRAVYRDLFWLPSVHGGGWVRAEAVTRPGVYRLCCFIVEAAVWTYTEPPVTRHWWTIPIQEQRDIMAQFVKRADTAREATRDHERASDAAFRGRYPALFEWLSLDHYEDGAPRETSTLLFFIDDGAFKACLNDRDQGRSLWAAGGSFDATMQALEALLATGDGDWRSSGGGKDKKRRK